MSRPLRILTWHIHGSYLYYLVQTGHEFYLPVKPGSPVGYNGRAGAFPWPDTVQNVPADEVRHLDLDCVLFQSANHYTHDQYEILSPAQQRLPRIYLEHDPPREHPTDTPHLVDDPNILLVHVTPFNNLMWNNGRTPTCVIEHGVLIPHSVAYTGEISRGLVVVNNLRTRGRRLGADIFAQVRQQIPLDLVGMGADAMGGLGEVSPPDLPAFASRYRFFFNPIRYTSLGLAVCEAMMVGLPIIGLATTEMATTVENGVSGYVHTDIRRLLPRMQELLDNPAEARRLSVNARRYAQTRFNIRRFIQDWNRAFAQATGREVSLSDPVESLDPAVHSASFRQPTSTGL
jgi:hypothetical protein